VADSGCVLSFLPLLSHLGLPDSAQRVLIGLVLLNAAAASLITIVKRLLPIPSGIVSAIWDCRTKWKAAQFESEAAVIKAKLELMNARAKLHDQAKTPGEEIPRENGSPPRPILPSRNSKGQARRFKTSFPQDSL
jgi:hypothetical protein